MTIGNLLFATAMLMIGSIIPVFSADLQKLSDGRLISDPANDGDSFLVEADGKSFRIRLYFVDCPETSMSFKSDAVRVREQTRYFGLVYSTRTIHFGNEAKTFSNNALAKPFTVHTAFASALGRSSKGRVYGFITTAEGNDLAGLLVKNGFARTYGKGKKTPDGVSSEEMIERLRDLETSAMLKHVGIWSESNPERIAEFRGKQRKEDRELQEIQNQGIGTKSSQALLNLNTATEIELQAIKGIGPVISKRIITGRPYRIVDDLLKVKGISRKKLENIRQYFVVGDSDDLVN